MNICLATKLESDTGISPRQNRSNHGKSRANGDGNRNFTVVMGLLSLWCRGNREWEPR